MDDLNGYYEERDGVKVIVLREPYSDKTYDDMVRIAIEIMRGE